MISPGPGRTSRVRPAGGFTLIELLIVMVIIGILMAFILNAAMDGARRAEERATQSLITKLETGLNDRIDALLLQRADVHPAHSFLSSVIPSSILPGAPPGILTPSPQRAAVIAQYDYVRAEIPDAFLYDSTNSDYPINFAALPYNFGTSTGMTYAPFILPLGNAFIDNWNGGSYGSFEASWTANGGVIPSYYTPAGTGIFGASYSVRSGLMKNLKYLNSTTNQLTPACPPAAYDGVDNNNDGLIDNLTGEVSSTDLTNIQTALSKHNPTTARSEALYAMLVEGQGPLGTIFRPDDFTTKEVQDTDGDGLPEFVDAWGQPLQFYRWPIFYHSDLQRGLPIALVNPQGGGTQSATFSPPYGNVFEQREQDTLDPNQMLVSPSWWQWIALSQLGQTATLTTAGGFFQSYFHILSEPTAGGSPNPTNNWDRSTSTSFGTIYPRREFYSKFLIASAGPDGQLGLFQAFSNTQTVQKQPTVNTTNIGLLILEGYATQGDPTAIPSGGGTSTTQSTINLQNQGADDITNQTLTMPGQGS